MTPPTAERLEEVDLADLEHAAEYAIEQQWYSANVDPRKLLKLLTAYRELLEENERLRGLAREIYEDWPESSELDGWTLQDIAVKHGLLVPERRTTFCAEGCYCSEYADEGTPFTCFRRAGALKVEP